ncbi:Nn.00g116120.m01.CDS01 [Neocucurbitaria sp. VM-36]
MVVINPEPAALSAEDLSLFYTTDELLSNSPVLIFYGPTATSTQATHSRIQTHVFTPAGLQSFARLIISPTATFYNAVTCLPREEQGDEICRGLAFSLYKYFVELPPEIKHAWEKRYSSMGHLPSAPKMFSESHAAIIAAKMVKVENVADVIVDVRHALGEQTLSWIDLDVVLPQGSIQKVETRESAQFDESEDDISQQRYGQYAPIVKLFGETAFLPTSRLRRAPSKPTALNRSQSFSRKQKETLRREMCELLDTEENYVSKLNELVHTVAVEFRDKARHKSLSSSSPNEEALQALFPPSLDKILEINAKFLDTIRIILEETENGAIEDIEQATDAVFIAPLRGQKDPIDVTGAAAVAKALVEWFPQFGDCYTDYMAAHGDFSQLLKIFTKDAASSFSKRVYETGEQRLMSMLIEPVQRLPRYNLYIDNIIKQLPVRHPAIKTFLKARDIISEICSREGPTAQQIRVFDRLRKLVSGWPTSFNPQGRLITAIDYVELSPPYHGDLSGPSTMSGIFVLFTDFFVLLNKSSGCTTSARSLLADLDNPKFAESFSGSTELTFHQHLKLCDVFVSEHSEGSILQILSPTPSSTQPTRPRSRERQYVGIRMFYLHGAYEGKGSKAVEEFTKARVEGRFPEAEREGHKWEVRSLTGDLSFFSSISEETGSQKVEGRKEPAKVQILVEASKHSQSVRVADEGIELTVTISMLGDGFFLLDTAGANGYAARDKLTNLEFLPVLTKRLANYFQLRNSVRNAMLSETYLFRNQQILKSLSLQLSELEEEQGSKSRPHSPVKMLSSLFGSSVSREGGSRRLQRNPHTLGEIPRMAPPLQPTQPRTYSRDGDTSRPTSSNKNAGFNPSVPTDSLARLEESLANLTLAIHARKGNIVGRSVRARSVADELIVNELYNSLLENPSNLDLAGQCSVDVLFAVFEKFLDVAWKERMGPVLSHAMFVSLQMRSDSMYPGEFEEFFRTTFNELTPQNQRALRAIIHLLAELLDGTSNDGDRGVLTAAFAEMLVPAGNANDFISLMDRLVQDIDALFPIQTPRLNTPNYGSMDSKGRATAAGSINSNTSLRKRFGFGTLTRENSKSESESKVGSLWRSLSKNSHGTDSQPSSLSKAGPASLNRSNSTDAARLSPKRPSSRDRPTVLGAFTFENASSSSRAFLGALGTIGEVPPTAGPPRKKRRSSLSDLKTLQDANDAPMWSPQTPRRPESGLRDSRLTSASPRTPSRTTPSPAKHTSAIPTPTRLGSPMRKENSPANVLDRAGGVRPKSLAAKPEAKEEVTIKSYSPTKKRGESVTGIPSLKPATSSGLSERPGSGNTIKMPPPGSRSPTKTGTPSASPPKRLRMQSPQKLRERLQNQQRDIDTASEDLQNELSAIGQELNARSIPRLTTQSSAPPSTSGSSPTKSLESRIATLEKQLKSSLDALSARNTGIANDVSSSLQVSEARCKHLDQLYRDMNAENEALYARFNEELDKVTSSARKGKASEEVERRLKASEEEAARLRKENARLKREVAGLKAQIRE